MSLSACLGLGCNRAAKPPNYTYCDDHSPGRVQENDHLAPLNLGEVTVRPTNGSPPFTARLELGGHGSRELLSAIREHYRNAPVEEVDDSEVIGFGQRESSSTSRPPRRKS